MTAPRGRGRGGFAVAEDGDTLVRAGAPTFYLADTAWSALFEASEAEWEEYLSLRRRQGFNAVQLSVLPILHDRTISVDVRNPFRTDEHDRFVWDAPSEAFFATAEAMLERVVEHDMVPTLVLLWCTYVEGSWAADRHPGHQLPAERLEPYLHLVLSRFARFDPVLFVSGDTDFADPRVEETYRRALAVVGEVAPTSLTAMHMQPNTRLPAAIAASPFLTLHAYQSGHHLEEQHLAYELASEYVVAPVRRPTINAEPCYEGHGWGYRFGRIGPADVRRAAWQSLLSGARAGLAYAAHGTWQWHRRGAPFTGEAFSSEPFDWSTALQLPGAWDMALLRELAERMLPLPLAPRQDLLVDAPDGVRACATPVLDRIAVYAPHATALRLAARCDAHEAVVWNLGERRPERVALRPHAGGTTIEVPAFNGDALTLIGFNA